MYIYIYIYIYARTHTHIHTYIHTYTQFPLEYRYVIVDSSKKVQAVEQGDKCRSLTLSDELTQQLSNIKIDDSKDSGVTVCVYVCMCTNMCMMSSHKPKNIRIDDIKDSRDTCIICTCT